jgi:hypothetical protein
MVIINQYLPKLQPVAKAAVIRLKALARQMNLGKFDWEKWKHYRDTGRK